jgi:hypothetical protein
MTNRRTTMAKATKATKPTVVGDVELRRWCIEQAIRWPEVGAGGYHGIASGGGGYHGIASGGGGYRTEANIIDRASRLLTWVRGG